MPSPPFVHVYPVLSDRMKVKRHDQQERRTSLWQAFGRLVRLWRLYTNLDPAQPGDQGEKDKGPQDVDEMFDQEHEQEVQKEDAPSLN